jgi:hypothetical protein
MLTPRLKQIDLGIFKNLSRILLQDLNHMNFMNDKEFLEQKVNKVIIHYH